MPEFRLLVWNYISTENHNFELPASLTFSFRKPIGHLSFSDYLFTPSFSSLFYQDLVYFVSNLLPDYSAKFLLYLNIIHIWHHTLYNQWNFLLKFSSFLKVIFIPVLPLLSFSKAIYYMFLESLSRFHTVHFRNYVIWNQLNTLFESP